MGGTDGSSYGTPTAITINKVVGDQTAPTAKSFSASSTAGSATL